MIKKCGKQNRSKRTSSFMLHVPLHIKSVIDKSHFFCLLFVNNHALYPQNRPELGFHW